MHPFTVLLNLAAAVMLLLWAVRMVRTGVERANAAVLKGTLRNARANHIQAAFSGAVMAVLLQSSTAVGLLAAGFVTSGILGVSAGIATMLGADFGSALVVRILSFDLAWLIPLLLLAGATLFLKFEGRTPRQTGRILLGIGFVLLSLKMIGDSTEPLRDSRFLPQIVTYLKADPLTAFALAALFTWLVHSSIATVLLLATMATRGLLPLEVALPMVLGANLGGGMISVWLTRNLELKARRVPLGNLLFRAGSAVAGLFSIMWFVLPMERLGSTEARQIVNFHLVFNGLLVVLALPFSGLMEKLVNRMLPERVDVDATLLRRPQSALDESAIASPGLALASATRECLRIGETLETMFSPMMNLFEHATKEQVDRIRQFDEEVNRSHTAIKLFIAKVNRGTLNEEEARRGIELADFAINMEHVGDIIAKTLLPLVKEKNAKNLNFSEEGWKEMENLHARVQSNIQLCLNVLVSGDVESARQLVREKETMRKLERSSHERHLQRLQTGMVRSIETSDIHLETVRAFKEINSLLATVAYPILRHSGGLLESRLSETSGSGKNL
ncbi:MAG: Na/Pi cotransporter family protein [Rhizobiaceae bacterium]